MSRQRHVQPQPPNLDPGAGILGPEEVHQVGRAVCKDSCAKAQKDDIQAPAQTETAFQVAAQTISHAEDQQDR